MLVIMYFMVVRRGVKDGGGKIMELNQLRYLVKLSEIQNFSKAAEALYITQPTLSQQIGRLEEELGVKFFERTTRSVVLTEIGSNCAACAKAALESIDDMVSAAEKYKRSENTELLVGILTVLPQIGITDIIADFREKRPETKIELMFGWSADLIEMLLQKKLDIIISNVYFEELKNKREKLNIVPFLEDRLVVVVSNRSPYADREEIALQEFVHERFWVVDPNSSVKIAVERKIQESGYPMPEFKNCHSMASVMKMVASNLGVSVISSNVAKEYLLPEVKIVPIVPRIKTSTAIITLKDGKESRRVKDFKEFFLNSIS